MSAFHIWRDDPPPRDTVVEAKYALTGDKHDAQWQRVRTCKRGCCVRPEPNDGMGSLLLPKYWREPTPEDVVDAVPSTNTTKGKP